MCLFLTQRCCLASEYMKYQDILEYFSVQEKKDLEQHKVE